LSAQTLRGLYEALLRERSAYAPARTKPQPFRLKTLDQLHFLDWHACTLLARSGLRTWLVIEAHPPLHLQSRVDAILLDQHDGPTVEYEPGATLARFLNTPDWPNVWRDYQTSHDEALQPSAGVTLSARFPHLRSGFVSGIDLFNMGEYYAAHEDLESLWVRLEEGAERCAAQGLIQLAGAHIHRLKGRPVQSRKLYQSARELLSEAASLDWLDVRALVRDSDSLLETCDPVEPNSWPSIPLINQHAFVARKHR
jgi:predicted metal-dependent hydrolase